MKVVATAPIPGVRTPSLPVGGAISTAAISLKISDYLTLCVYNKYFLTLGVQQ
jgi:hypothetical protein